MLKVNQNLYTCGMQTHFGITEEIFELLIWMTHVYLDQLLMTYVPICLLYGLQKYVKKFYFATNDLKRIVIAN